MWVIWSEYEFGLSVNFFEMNGLNGIPDVMLVDSVICSTAAIYWYSADLSRCKDEQEK